MDQIQLSPDLDRNGLIYRMNAGYRFRFAGSDAQNDGIQAEMDIGYRSRRFFGDRFSLESGSTIDLFGETEHLGAYLQLNYHHRDHWIFSARAMGGGVSDNKEAKPTATTPAAAKASEDSDDLGEIFGFSLMGAYRLDANFILGARIGYIGEAFGNGPGDQGTQHSLTMLANLAYQF